MATIRPDDLPAAASVNPAAALIVDDGATVEKATPIQVVDAAIPLASQAEAEAGVNNTKRMTPLRVAQALAALGLDADNINFLPAGTGAVTRSAQAKMRDAPATLYDFGASSAAADNAVPIQKAVDALRNNEIGSLCIPAETFDYSAAPDNPDNIITGLHIFGENKISSVLNQTTNDEPHFLFSEVDIMHSCHFHDFKMTWDTPQTGNSNATGFRFVKKAAGANQDVYENHFHDLFIDNCYTFMRGDTDFWGNVTANCFVHTEGATVNLDGTGGQPKNIWMNVYSFGGAAGEIHYRCNSMVCDYWVEVNGGSALMLRDWGGGTHTVHQWPLEVASYAASGTLWDCLNSILICQTKMYAVSLTLTGTTALDMFRTSGTNGFIKVEAVDWNFASQAIGTVFTVLGNAGADRQCEFGHIIGTLTAPAATPVAQLTNVPSTAIAERVKVREWVEPTRALIVGDANVTLDQDDPFEIQFGTVPLTADRAVTMVRHNAVSGNSYFRGPRHKFTKFPGAGTSFKIDIVDYAGSVIATIPAATASGSKTVRWDRSSPDGTAGVGFLTAEPLPV